MESVIENNVVNLRFGLSPEQERAVLSRAKKLKNALKQERDYYDSDYYELSRQFAPHLFRNQTTQRTTKSLWKGIINNTGRRALRTLASGMQAGLTSPSRPWLKLGIEDTDLAEFHSVRDWLQTTTNMMLTIFRRTRMYDTAHMVYTNLGAFGTGSQIIIQDFEEMMLFKALMMGRYWIGINNKGRVEMCVIERHMNIEQMVREYGINNVDADTRNAYDKGDYYLPKIVYIAIFKNPYAVMEGTKAIIASNEKPFISCHWTNNHERPLKTAGFNRFPVQAPRWEVTDDEAWGVGTGHDAIGDTNAMQLKEREKAKGLQKMVSPSLSAPAEMRGGQFPISGLPGGVTYRPQNAPPDAIRTTFEVNLPLQYLMQDIQIDEDRVNRAFYADLFLMLANSDRRQMTATEVAERHEEKLLALGSVVERLNYEYLDPMVERTFEIMRESGIVPEAPPELDGVPLKIEYISLLAQAQQQVGIGSIEKFMSFTGFAAQYKPEALDKVNVDEAIDNVGRMLGVPSSVVVSDDKVAQVRKQRAQEQQAQLQQQQAMGAIDAAKSLSETPIGDNNALEQLVGGNTNG